MSVVSPGQAARELSVRRAHVEVPSLEDVKIVDAEHGVAYIRIPAFQKTTARDLEAALWDLHAKGMRSLVLDLRGNPGGLLTASVEVADKFIADGAIVSTRGRSEQENFNYRAHRPGTWRVPLVVLIDGDSASASEIFAAAIKDSQPRHSDRHAVLRQRLGARHLPARLRRRGRPHHHGQVLLAHGSPNQQRRSNPRHRCTSCYAGGQWCDEQSGGPQLAASGNMHQVGFRGVDDAPQRRCDLADATLDLAIEVAQNQPVAQL